MSTQHAKNKLNPICRSSNEETDSEYTKDSIFALIRNVYLKNVNESCLPELREQMLLML